MPQLKIGIQLASLQLPFTKALHTAAELGAQAVEIDARRELRPPDLSGTGLREVRKMLADRNLRVSAVGFRTRRGYHVSEGLDRRIDATKEALRLARDLGCTTVINQVGRVPEEFAGTEWGLLQESLRDLGAYGERVGAFLAAETGSEEGTARARLIEALPAGCLGVNLNPGNLIVHGFSPLEAAQALGRYVVHVHAKDGVPDAARGQGMETPLGRGTADFPQVLSILEEHAYRGYFTIERGHCDDPVREIGQAMQYLRSF